MRLSDTWARRIGVTTLAMFIGGPVLGLVLMDRVRDWIAAGVGFGLPLVGLIAGRSNATSPDTCGGPVPGDPGDRSVRPPREPRWCRRGAPCPEPL